MQCVSAKGPRSLFPGRKSNFRLGFDREIFGSRCVSDRKVFPRLVARWSLCLDDGGLCASEFSNGSRLLLVTDSKLRLLAFQPAAAAKRSLARARQRTENSSATTRYLEMDAALKSQTILVLAVWAKKTLVLLVVAFIDSSSRLLVVLAGAGLMCAANNGRCHLRSSTTMAISLATIKAEFGKILQLFGFGSQL